MGYIKDCLIIRSELGDLSEYNAFMTDGLKEKLEDLRWSVIDLSGDEATPSNVHYWLKMDKRRISKMLIFLGNATKDALIGQREGEEIDVIKRNNIKSMTQNLDVFTFAPETAAEGGIGELAVDLGCHSWLGYTGEIAFSEEYKEQIREANWNYIFDFAKRLPLRCCKNNLCRAYTELSLKCESLKANKEGLRLINKYD